MDGLYSGPPSDPHSELIHTYIKEKHEGEITFGDKSRVGRGGMTAKVKAAVYAAYAGIPVVITRSANFQMNFSILFIYYFKCIKFNFNYMAVSACSVYSNSMIYF